MSDDEVRGELQELLKYSRNKMVRMRELHAKSMKRVGTHAEKRVNDDELRMSLKNKKSSEMWNHRVKVLEHVLERLKVGE